MKKIMTVLIIILISVFVFSRNYTEELDLVLVETYSFSMGNPCVECNSNFPLLMHYIDFTYDYFIGRYELSKDLFMEFVKDTNLEFSIDDNIYYEENPLNPICGVSWQNAVNFCNWLCKKYKLPPSYDNEGNLLDEAGCKTDDPSEVAGFRLPTDAEWEQAATGGIFTTFCTYSGSDDINEVCWYRKNSDFKIHPVGSLESNELGLYDMSGNLWEWVTDSSYHINIYGSHVVNPYYNTNDNKIIRGGGANSIFEYCKPFYRFENDYNEEDPFIGFRIAITRENKDAKN